MMIESILEQIAFCVEWGKVDRQSAHPVSMQGMDGAYELTRRALDEGLHPAEVLNAGLIEGMKRIGIKFRENRAFIPEVLIASKAMNTAMEHIKPFYESKEISYKGKFIIGTVAGDMHDIGKNIAGMVLRGGGWEIIDLGVNVSADIFLSKAEVERPLAVGLSALLTTTMMNMAEIIDKFRQSMPEIRFVVGGAPLSQAFASTIGADHYARDPHCALEYLDSLIA